ncbi:MAG: tRNA pseudouridine synthase 10 [Planctomycetota bacterium]|jgi:tRNA pseudouridine synthase 10
MNQPPNQPRKAKLYIEGRYLKHSRDLPQTLFFCPECKGHARRRHKCKRCEGFGKLTKDSVQELIGWVVAKAAGTRKHKFHGAGREDVDVRMLGDGRPFVFELESPKIMDIDLAELEATINSRNEGRMEVRGLHWTQRSRIRFLKEGKFVKDYRAKAAVSSLPDPEKVQALLGHRYVVAQKTPSRVAHRRADLVRERWIEILEVEVPAEQNEEEPFLFVTMRTQAGTYVKEAISGEGGMTEPSVASQLGIDGARCLELDVLGILDEEGEESSEVIAEPSSPQSQSPFGAGL